MDIALDLADYYIFTPYIYPSSWPENDLIRQFISLLIIVNIGGYVLYLSTATLSYFFIYDHRLLKHPQILENQVAKEISYTLKSLIWMSFPTCLLFLLEVHGYSNLYDDIHQSKLGHFSIVVDTVSFLFFTDMLIYWIHRYLHHPWLYRYIHKPHHKWKIPTPFASHAFHPIDGFLQSCPYHIYPFLFPLHKYVYLALFVFVNIWTVSIHDGDFRVPKVIEPIINGSAHHTDHHLFFNYNYGQFFTLWDRFGGSFRYPSAFEGTGPLTDVLKLQECAAKKKD
ncbi:lathosterol oxidase-like [Saccoglossus kowalevskii]|uniref:Lathosterol oxidase-like n=1 Tax=Saccoglossus kowalevskii TaxID=10224 RepID=A0ABM0GVI8_SACKO|nr:PREDICTED: lathosterol oxidase-like [Saccoglossus kowalevskii]